jgi:hypothetical protein
MPHAPWIRTVWLAGAWLLAVALPGHAAPQPMSDTDLAGVHAAGIAIGVHLELNAGLLNGQRPGPNLVAGFQQDGSTTYLVLHGVGGVMDLQALTLDIRQRPNGAGDVLDIGLPQFAGFAHFGFRALAVQADPNGAAEPGHCGGLLLNGTLGMTGHVYLWAR